MIFAVGCEDVLEIEPTDKLSAEQMFSDPGGVRVYMANLYYQMPVEDFTYFPKNSPGNVFNYNGSNPNNGGFAQVMHTDNAMHSEFGTPITNPNYDHCWNMSYSLIRDVNTLIDIIPGLDIFEEEKQQLKAEASFIRAYTYYALAKRYGGVPLILTKQEYTSDVDELRVPRSTEKETWELVLAECDTAAKYLPESWAAPNDRRATKWAALALKSRAALHAASVAKYWDQAPLTGEAVDQGLVGMDAADAQAFYQACVDASDEIITSGNFNLYGAGETDPAVAAENYRKLFENPNIDNNEVIFAKGYTLVGDDHTANNYEIWYNPNQLKQSWPHPGRMNPTLDFVEKYETYGSAPGDTTLFETVTGDEEYFGFDPTKNYVQYDTPTEIFEGRDARLYGAVILPGTEWKNTEIVIQAGFIEPDGTPKLYQKTSIEVDGETYYTYGAADVSNYSGFDPAGGNHTRTGFLFKKFLKEDEDVSPEWNAGTLDWIDMRYAEVLLNYAEAVVEGEFADHYTAAENALNEIRSRAAHTTTVPLTLDNVLRERRIELSFENKRFYDLVRRREFHLAFDNRIRNALLPVLDLRGAEPKYIFIRDQVGGNGKSAPPQTWRLRDYYRYIPGIGSNGLVQNPQY